MALIKSALELALEKTSSVKSDKEGLEAYQYKTEGKKLVSEFQADPTVDVPARLKSYSGKQASYVKEGMTEVLFANLVLPYDEAQIQNLDAADKILSVMTTDKKKTAAVMAQLRQFFTQYLADRKQVRESVEKHFAPRLRQKEQELSRKYGQPVRLDISQDQEASMALKQNIQHLEVQYQGALDEAKDQLKALIEK